MRRLLLVPLLLVACSSTSFYSLPSLPFALTLPSDYEYLDSEANIIFSPKDAPATFVFEKAATRKAFFELFEGGYTELTEKSSGVWVICDESSWGNCYVQNMNFMNLYPLHIKSDAPLNDSEKEEVTRLLQGISAD